MAENKNCDFDLNALAGKYAGRIDLARFVEGVTAVINDVVDAAMDGVLEAADAIAWKAEEAREGTDRTRERVAGWRWRDDDDPPCDSDAAEAMR